MAKTASQVAVTQGSGVGLSTFDLATGRKRQTVILADADGTGEQAVAELPPHDDVDRGSALKIGGRASAAPFADVGGNDRTDAWFSLNGQQGAISTIEPAMVYDGGRRPVLSAGVTGLSLISPSTGVVVPAAPGLRTKVLEVHVQLIIFNTAGSLGLFGAGFNFWFAQFSAIGSAVLQPANLVHYSTAVNTALALNYTGNATFNVGIVYYQAP